MKARRATRSPPLGAADFAATFDALRAVLASFAKTMTVETDRPGLYSLLAQPTAKCPDGIPFASVRTGKAYVSFHLLPMYACAELHAGLSPELRARMQGKSCFNFRSPPAPDLLREMTALVRAGRDRFRKLKLP